MLMSLFQMLHPMRRQVASLMSVSLLLSLPLARSLIFPARVPIENTLTDFGWVGLAAGRWVADYFADAAVG